MMGTEKPLKSSRSFESRGRGVGVGGAVDVAVGDGAVIGVGIAVGVNVGRGVQVGMGVAVGSGVAKQPANAVAAINVMSRRFKAGPLWRDLGDYTPERVPPSRATSRLVETDRLRVV